ncbi:hypothetical protein PUNSTDRAFT_94475 [Punctularia strigosozonata HHB-11173 SS5]|uniref:uncharacterized protein n=1 Tax=Punctularia strigosozonata (strain HHB-11173) TaxID=741275 RepID=UPI0004417D84|nr:uncharacterized protein PUNSTDRAFT_94475 [Punctularia strigosozonata HHB-11173 SS5]EIN13423.1 hypothetical protein PUNSTDRAFT_94475 [Punctularia strigosozonata HHB-11173 SS5]
MPRRRTSAFLPSFPTALLSWTLCTACVAAKVTPFLQQSFYFDYAPSSQPVPIPTTIQCDTIDITWSRQSATGPSPTAPYYLQIYTSTFVVPLVVPAGSGLEFDWPVPFTPGTQYQICMFDKNGNPGGCQRMYTVIPNANTTLDEPVTCTNLSYPHPDQVLDVEGTFWNGPISQFGWPDQCTDIQLTPKNGTPPFTLTVAPALHPPYNITSKTMDPINWTVSLNWGQPFFLSLVDSEGNGWAQGPLHAGQNGPTSCLDLSSHDTGKTVSAAVAAGSSVAGLVVGACLGLFAGWLFLYYRQRDRRPYFMRRGSKTSLGHIDDPHTPGFGSLSDYSRVPLSPNNEFGAAIGGTHSAGPSTSSSRIPHMTSQYHIEPFIPPSMGSEPTAPAGAVTSDGRQSPSQAHSRVVSGGSTAEASTTGQQVYVVHHDGGRAPVTVYTANGAEVVELPPSYVASAREVEPGASDSGRSGSDSSRAPGSGPEAIHQRRQPNMPRKQAMRLATLSHNPPDGPGPT